MTLVFFLVFHKFIMPTTEAPAFNNQRISTTAIVFNTGYLKSFSGILKLCQLVLGAFCVGIISFHLNRQDHSNEYFFMHMSVTFLISSFCVLLACLTSVSTGNILAKTNFDWIYHCVAFVLYLVAAIVLLGETIKEDINDMKQDSYWVASMVGFIVAGLYLASFIVALFTFKSK